MIFMSWPALLKAKDNLRNISIELGRMLNGVDVSIAMIDEEIKDMKNNLKQHRKYFESKSVFLRRHHKRL